MFCVESLYFALGEPFQSICAKKNQEKEYSLHRVLPPPSYLTSFVVSFLVDAHLQDDLRKETSSWQVGTVSLI